MFWFIVLSLSLSICSNPRSFNRSQKFPDAFFFIAQVLAITVQVGSISFLSTGSKHRFFSNLTNSSFTAFNHLIRSFPLTVSSNFITLSSLVLLNPPIKPAHTAYIHPLAYSCPNNNPRRFSYPISSTDSLHYSTNLTGFIILFPVLVTVPTGSASISS